MDKPRWWLRDLLFSRIVKRYILAQAKKQTKSSSFSVYSDEWINGTSLHTYSPNPDIRACLPSPIIFARPEFLVLSLCLAHLIKNVCPTAPVHSFSRWWICWRFVHHIYNVNVTNGFRHFLKRGSCYSRSKLPARLFRMCCHGGRNRRYVDRREK